MRWHWHRSSLFLALLLALFLAVLLAMAGCSHVRYYAQATHGQLSLLAAAQPVEVWLAQPDLEPRLRQRLEAAGRIRRFAVTELALPQNGSYQSYVDIARPFVLWNVVATDEFSFVPRSWCFPVAGCVSYRGYYSESAAKAYADQLRASGADVQVSGVPAYSTLGWFNDPLISSFIYYPESELARLMFHELAHQVLYLPGDTRFNEAFASAVEEAGLQRWLAQNGLDAMRSAHQAAAMRKKQFLALLLNTRTELEALYADPQQDVPQKRRAKGQIFEQMRASYQQLKQGWGGYAGYDRWFAAPLSNAHWVAVANYEQYVPAFRALLAGYGAPGPASLPQFYAAARELSRLPQPEREQALLRLASAAKAGPESDSDQ